MYKKILMIFTILFFAFTDLFSKPLIRIVSKDIRYNNPEDVKYMKIGVDGLKKQGIDIDIEIVKLAGGSYKEKLPLMIMGGDVPDIIYDQYGFDKSMAEQGILEDLRPYINSSKILKNAMWAHNKERINNFPYLIRAHPPRIRIAYARNDWLIKSGKNNPQNLDDYYSMLKSFSTSDFDGNGAKDTFGFTMTGNTKRCDWIFDPVFKISKTWMNKNGKFEHKYISSEQKEKLTFYNKLYKEGILDPEYITTKWDTMEDKFYAGKVGMICGSVGITGNTYQTKMSNAHNKKIILVALKPPANKFGPIDGSKEPRGYMISALSKHKKEAFAFLEFFASSEGLITEQLGIEGIYHKKNNGNYELTKKHGNWEPRFWEPNIPAPVDIHFPVTKASLNYAAEMVTYDNKFNFPAELSGPADSSENIYWEYSYKFISGELPLSQFNNYRQEWLDSGGNEITEYANTILK